MIIDDYIVGFLNAMTSTGHGRYCWEPAAAAGILEDCLATCCSWPCRRPDMRQLYWRNHVTTFDAVRMPISAVRRRDSLIGKRR